ncbi:CYTH and CHAD domain-containing protein [Streptomyces sp. NBC_01551]|uniref:CYTH and CHAD domain-containing protein n=1 Tax=Streptomyces sp. NBC_01551 TaxID=2975876 RepID=UPI0022591AD8|nr:CYTH and CHAD domain-containing protein [Streptomyces sp. NBC_01551]MCX4525846.1 CYTH and CHAD domain-containing protein [Streptomyces sp. NBC_01551]
MADTKREIERKFEFPEPDGAGGTGKAGKSGKKASKAARHALPDLAGTAGIAAVRDEGTVDLDAVYYDTRDQRLAADGLTLRRRTGGGDAGWHLKLPVSPGVRDEVSAPLGDSVPPALAALVRSRVRGAALEPQVRLRSSRKVSHLLDADGAVLAELSTDTVRAEREEAAAAWTEVEVELADGVDPALLDAVEKRFGKAGLRVSDAPSKVARALDETGAPPPARPEPAPDDDSAGAYVLSYLREQLDAVIAQDPAVRRNLPDSVHQLRVATRRTRSAFKTYREVLDRDVTDPLGDELRWLAAELGVDRDQEVLLERLQTRLGELPRTLLLGPVRGRLRVWNNARRSGSRRRALAALDSKRYLTLLDSLDALLADPPLLEGAARPAEDVLPQAVIHDHGRLAKRIGAALDLEPGHERDLALHEARKAAKRSRYAAEAAVPALGKPAKRLAKAVKKVQTLLGDHQDSVVAREALLGLGVQAAAAGESAFTWGVLHAREEALADRRERELPDVWEKASDPARRAPLAG